MICLSTNPSFSPFLFRNENGRTRFHQLVTSPPLPVASLTPSLRTGSSTEVEVRNITGRCVRTPAYTELFLQPDAAAGKRVFVRVYDRTKPGDSGDGGGALVFLTWVRCVAN